MAMFLFTETSHLDSQFAEAIEI